MELPVARFPWFEFGAEKGRNPWFDPPCGVVAELPIACFGPVAVEEPEAPDIFEPAALFAVGGVNGRKPVD